MRKMVLAALTAFALVMSSGARAQEAASPDAAAGSDEQPLNQSSLSESLEEAPPRPEPPYPGSDQGDTISRRPRSTPAPVQRPLKVDDEGNYYYGTDLPETTTSNRPGIVAPDKTNKQGEYYYDTRPETPEFSNRPGVEKPVEMKATGEFNYETERSPMSRAASVRLGVIAPPDIRNPNNGLSYRDVYGDSPMPVLLGDYEWPLVTRAGRLSLKLGSGLLVSSGQGRFKNRPAEEAEERFTFVVFPNQLTASYKFQYAERQVIVPFVEGGGGYFAFAELRDDNRTPRIGGALVSVAAGGLNFLLDGLDPRAIRNLDNDYGINHVWLTTEVRVIVGLNPDFDFGSQMINAGIMVEF